MAFYLLLDKITI